MFKGTVVLQSLLFVYARRLLFAVLILSLITGPAVWIRITTIRTKPWKVSWISTESDGIDTLIKLLVVSERAPNRTPHSLPLPPDILTPPSTTAAIAYIS